MASSTGAWQIVTIKVTRSNLMTPSLWLTGIQNVSNPAQFDTPSSKVRTLNYLPLFNGPAGLGRTRGWERASWYIRCSTLYRVAPGSSEKTTSNHFAPMSTPEGYNTPQAKLLLELDQGFEKKDIDLIAKPLHKDFVHKTHPRSLGSPDLTREQWLQHLQGIISLWTDREVR